MLREYQKIGNIFKFDEKYKRILGKNEPYETLKNLIWQGTEKIDGTNIRVYWDGHTISYIGRTDKSDLPKHLDKYLADTFLTQEMEYVFEQMFEDKEVHLFGEGYGAKIQSGGGDYVQGNDECGFILFDVNINGFDLKRKDVNDIADKLGLPSVPVVFEGTLDEAIEFVSKHPASTLNNGKHEMEGIVLVPRDIQLYDNKQHLIKCKCKYQDLRKANLINIEV